MGTVALKSPGRVEQTEMGTAAVPPAARVLGARLARAVQDVDVERLGGALDDQLGVAAVPLVGSGDGERQGCVMTT